MLTIVISIAILCLIYLSVCYFVYRFAFHAPDSHQNDPYFILNGKSDQTQKDLLFPLITELLEKPFEEVHIKSFDGLDLAGRLYLADKDAPVGICFHGWRGLSIRDFCYGARILFDLGHNVLIIEERAQGMSSGHTMTFGVNEKQDALSWISYISGRFGPEKAINLFGVSMGAATVLMAAGLNLPENVKHIIADCPYSSPMKIISKVSRDMHLPALLCKPFIVGAARIFGHFSILDKASDATAAVKGCTIPTLIIHGEADSFVPCAMSEDIARANPLIQRETFPNADHGLSLVEDPERYIALVSSFLTQT